ncbi:hypothetical protein TNCT_318061 [Trichonephila clavata]|uniref:Uncharacterized protein n=1 Tax=Trichonephila clavata TaxID=2740835 RepID=A0A8X6H5Y9_TRICU|nr:hypothetical protein TNCT_318061 [Trichonephila clavata]
MRGLLKCNLTMIVAGSPNAPECDLRVSISATGLIPIALALNFSITHCFCNPVLPIFTTKVICVRRHRELNQNTDSLKSIQV